MLQTDPRSQAALEAAIQKIRTTLQSVLDRVCDNLGAAAQSSARISERDVCNSALVALRRQAAAFHRTFGQVLQDKIGEELAPRHDAGRTLATVNWQTLSLVGDDEMEERMFADRIGQTISHACDAELRELAPYVGWLLQRSQSEIERNPLRAEMLGAPLHRAIEVTTRESAERALLAREFGQAMARAMPACYADIVRELQARGVRPAVLTARSVEGHGSGGNSGYVTLASTRGELVDAESTGGVEPAGAAPTETVAAATAMPVTAAPATAVRRPAAVEAEPAAPMAPASALRAASARALQPALPGSHAPAPPARQRMRN